MAKFIEVTAKDGMHRLINTNIIEEVRINWDGGVDIYLAFNCPHAIEQDYISAKESYSEVKKMLLGGTDACEILPLLWQKVEDGRWKMKSG